MTRATDQAAESLSIRDFQRGLSDRESAARLLGALNGAFALRSPRSAYRDYVFCCSIFTALRQAKLSGPLVSMAGETAALYLQKMIREALAASRYDFVRSAADTLFWLGGLLDEEFYKVDSEWYAIVANERIEDGSSDFRRVFAAKVEISLRLDEMRDHLPAARRQCEDDETKTARLAGIEEDLRTWERLRMDDVFR